jgi:ubiquinone/menaquinone biosynthesis C-methylase UbiE
MEASINREAVNADLIQAYDRMAQLRDFDRYEEWKRNERRDFASRLMREGGLKLLDIGCGTGRDGQWFAENDFTVTCIDLSPKMIQSARRKGLDARVMDFMEPDFPPESFDALFALNALVHISHSELPATLDTLKTLLRPGGLFFLGQYGGSDFEGVLEKDNYRPKRFFSFPSEESLKPILEAAFTIESFREIPLEGRDYQFYSVVLRK